MRGFFPEITTFQDRPPNATTVNVYSLRAKPQPTVSTPVTWPEVEAVAKKGDASRLVFESNAALKRAEKHGDLFATA